MEASLQGNVCVVVGGSGAIGSAICRHFAEAGATCIVTYNHGKEVAKDAERQLVLINQGRANTYISAAWHRPLRVSIWTLVHPRSAIPAANRSVAYGQEVLLLLALLTFLVLLALLRHVNSLPRS